MLNFQLKERCISRSPTEAAVFEVEQKKKKIAQEEVNPTPLKLMRTKSSLKVERDSTALHRLSMRKGRREAVEKATKWDLIDPIILQRRKAMRAKLKKLTQKK